ncbi:MAG: hypothetical protein EZS28_018952 [Streblomastix strix]|uniref:DDE-1 domain-containing protein n=1 Tax=Streblomastix strix TaxID=222440 RepID=A0A5J4VSF7_9EUKA|nr:MAG: hypothetical protein EZS28_018952 [Streblomastix strix]
MAEAEAFFVLVSKRDFMTKLLFREQCTILINWGLEQKLTGYYAQDEKIILFVDGHPSRRDRDAIKLFKKKDIIALTNPRRLTFYMQPLDKVINGANRINYRNIFRTTRSKLCDKLLLMTIDYHLLKKLVYAQEIKTWFLITKKYYMIKKVRDVRMEDQVLSHANVQELSLVLAILIYISFQVLSIYLKKSHQFTIAIARSPMMAKNMILTIISQIRRM